MSLHIGIVACSAEGAALCYKTICVEGARFLGPHAHPEVSLHTHSLADYVECLDRGDRKRAQELLALAVIRPEVQRVIDKLGTVPVDIAPRFVTAERLLAQY